MKSARSILRSHLVAAPLALLVGGFAAPVLADPPGNCAPGTGMMGGGAGMGMGPGMMGGGMGMMGMMGSGMMGSGMMDMMGPGMMGGAGMGMMGVGPFAMLDLTNEQRQKIRDIQREQRQKQLQIAGKILEEQAQLDDLYVTDTPDPQKVGAVYGRIAKLQQQQIESQVAASNRMQAVLTKEQKEQLKQLRGGFAGGYGPGNMMMQGQGMMRR